MAAFMSAVPTKWFAHIVPLAMVAVISILMTTLLSWQIPVVEQIQLEVGKVAPYDIVAPAPISYESQVLTDRARERAAQNVPEQYKSSEGRVRRQQKNQARDILDFVTMIRRDPYATPELQADYLRAITDLQLTAEIALQIQQLDDAEWEAIVQETPLALDRIMGEEIRETTLPRMRSRVASFVDSDLSDEASEIAGFFVRALIRPNSFYDEERTLELREAAGSSVQVQTRTFARGETIIRVGDVATEEDVEALAQLGLLEEDWEWWVFLRAAVMSALIIVTAIGAIYHLRPSTLINQQELAAMAAIIIIWLIAAKFMIIPHEWVPYLYPLAAMSMLLTVLIDLRVSIVLIIAFSLTIHYLSNNNIIMVSYAALGAMSGALILGRAERLSAFLWAGLGVALCNLLTHVAFRSAAIDYSTPNWLTHNAPLYLSILLNGGLSASVALIGYFVLGNLFNLTTSLQLSELSRPAHPLLRQLLLKAPGTYHHTIVVSNLAERGAAAIGVDALLARVGAYYHDIGKTVRPYFFTENIMEGNSPHDKLDPTTSAQIIISHVTDGIDLAQKYRLPPRIRDFIWEHHGHSLVQYFYHQAQRDAKEGKEVDPEDFRYPGPYPRSKETAILLLADTCEAAVRSIRPSSRSELEKLVNKLIDDRVAEGALNYCDLTFKDLQTIRQVFIQVLQGVHHPRISYPQPVQPEEAKESASKEVASSSSPSKSATTTNGAASSANGSTTNGHPKEATGAQHENGHLAGQQDAMRITIPQPDSAPHTAMQEIAGVEEEPDSNES